jgi:microcystin-dependent protein
MSPVCAFPGSTWADTGNGLLKVRNADDSDWIVIGTIESDGTPKLNASGINNTPSGTISATNVQSAVNSLNVLPLLLRDTAYADDDVAFYAGLPSAMYLQCTTAGTTDTVNITIPSPVAVGDTITDGTVEWTVKKLGGSNIPVGAIIQYAVNGSLPEDFLACDGGAVSRTLYADLFGAIGTTYGSGDGSTTFNLPNYTGGTFPEGASTAGTPHAAGLPNIKGTNKLIQFGDYSDGTGAFSNTNNGAAGIQAASINGQRMTTNFDASLSNSVYSDSVTTVQPKSLTTRFIIKYQ